MSWVMGTHHTPHFQAEGTFILTATQADTEAELRPLPKQISTLMLIA
jgi:hypothetical protein